MSASVSSAPIGAYSTTSAPRCFVDIYPFEGGKYSFSDDARTLLACSVGASAQDLGSGFSLVLGPGGPNGTNSRPSWTDVLTQKSLVVIGMTRGAFSRIVMIGVIAACTEDSQREVDGARRNTYVRGDDFSVFFRSYSFYNLAVQTQLNGGVLGDLGYLSTLSDSLTHGTPDSIGQAWYSIAMAGDKGILSKTQFAYKGAPVLFGDLMATVFEPFPAAITVPMSADFLGAGSFAAKFATFFPFPWYEMFLVTAPAPTYAGLKGYTAAKTALSMTGFGDASPTFVARVNPLPTTLAQTAQYTATFSMEYTKWLALPLNQIYGRGERGIAVTYDDSEVRNFYVINPLLLSRQIGNSNSTGNPFMYTFASWVDNASIHRYGYRPQITETHWFSDPAGIAARQNAASGVTNDDFTKLVSDLALKVTSYHEPTPLMARAAYECELRPDIMPGTRLSIAPFRDGVDWQFYIETVDHSYVNGGKSMTRLGLTRGLPTSVYENSDLLLAIHLGNAMRQNGVITKGLPPGSGDPLSAILYNSVQHLLADNALMFATPQANTPATNPIRDPFEV